MTCDERAIAERRERSAAASNGRVTSTEKLCTTTHLLSVQSPGNFLRRVLADRESAGDGFGGERVSESNLVLVGISGLLTRSLGVSGLSGGHR